MADLFVRIWKYSEAPEEFKVLSLVKGMSVHGGKEDWVTHVPAQLVGFIPWLEAPHGDIMSRYPLLDASVVYIRAHS
jgi:hypothetical protein